MEFKNKIKRFKSVKIDFARILYKIFTTFRSQIIIYKQEVYIFLLLLFCKLCL